MSEPIVSPTESQLRTLRGIIYGIRCKLDGRFYVGRYRMEWWKEVENLYLKAAIHEHGSDAFEVWIFHHSISCQNERNRLEDEVATAYGSYHPTGYNIVPCGYNDHGHRSAEHYSRAHRASKPYRIKHFPSGEIFEGTNLNRFCKERGLRYSNVSRAIRVRGHTAKGGFTHPDTTQEDIDNCFLFTKWGFRGPFVLWRAGVRYAFTDAKAFMKTHRLVQTDAFRDVLKGVRPHYRGFGLEDRSPVYATQRWTDITLVDVRGQFVSFDNCRDYELKTGRCRGSLENLLNGKTQSTFGLQLHSVTDLSQAA